MNIKAVRSTKLVESLRQKAATMSRRKLSAALVASEKVRWWYWIQWGTAGRQDPKAPVKTTHAGTYPIDPVQALILRWPNAIDGGFVYRMHVDHPGIRPRLFVTKVENDIRRRAVQDFNTVKFSDPSEMERVLIEKTMPFAAEQVIASLATEAPGIRADGRLGGKSASEALADNLTIENRS